MANRRFNKQTTNSRTPMKVGGRAMKMGGGMSTARKDMASGYYKDDMGMKAGATFLSFLMPLPFLPVGIFFLAIINLF